ncbi:MAG TPA: hypothetical protein VNO30_02365 [Kofleriaceae bacterium]|nr:hypothetical protein [Kofleriaceae bacterium]
MSRLRLVESGARPLAPKRLLPGLLPALILAACWTRDAPPQGPSNQALAQGQACSSLDDVKSPPLDPQAGRLRAHVTGSLSADPRRMSGRTWTGDEVPGFVPRTLGTLELFLLDAADAGYLAFYREPYNLQSCQLSGAVNCAYEVRHYDRGGKERWRLPLNELLSRGDHLEIQDIRLAGGVLYFNEACQSYAQGAGGQCSSLVAVDPAARKVLWRTQPLVSNGRFVVRGCYVIAGYGFTAEPDHVFLVSRATGQVLQDVPLASAPEKMTLVGRDQLDVEIYSGAVGRFRLIDIEGPAGKLQLLDNDPAFAGSSYGGYGGARYGGYGGARYGGLRPVPRPRPRP